MTRTYDDRLREAQHNARFAPNQKGTLFGCLAPFIFTISFIIALVAMTSCAVQVFADELVREGRYVLLDDTDQTISEHNELHVAIREGQDWSREHEGRTFRIDPPRYRGSATPAEDDAAPLPVLDAQVIRVAPGDDITAAYARLRDGFPDRLEFARGAVYRGGLPDWNKSGRSAAEPMVVGAYGDPSLPAPLFLTDGEQLVTLGRDEVRHVVFRDLHATANLRDPASAGFVGGGSQEFGVRWDGRSSNIRFERIRLEHFYQCLNLSAATPGDVTVITLDGCVLIGAYNTTGAHSQGLGAGQVHGLTIRNCVLDHNGWNPQVPGSKRTGFNHNAYINGCRDVLIEGTVFSSGSGMGLKLRSDRAGMMQDVTIRGCLFVGNLDGIKASSDAADGVADAVVIERLVVEGNVFTHMGGSPDGGAELGVGVILEQVGETTIAGNLFIDKVEDTNWFAVAVKVSLPLGAVAITGNVVDRWLAEEPLINGAAANHAMVSLAANRVNTGAATRSLAEYAGDRGVYGLVDAIGAGGETCAGVVAWLFEGVTVPAIYTHHAALRGAYPGVLGAMEVIVDGDIGTKGELATRDSIDAAFAQGAAGRLVPKLDRARATGAIVLVDVEPFPRTPEQVAPYLAATSHLVDRIRAAYPGLHLSLYSHEWRDDWLHVGRVRSSAGDPWWMQSTQQAEIVRRQAVIEQVASALDAADLDLDALTPQCYQSVIWDGRWPGQPDMWFYAADWLPPVISHAQATGRDVLPIVWLWALDHAGNIVVADPDELRSICRIIYDAGIRRVMVWVHHTADLTAPGVAENIAIIMEIFGR